MSNLEPDTKAVARKIYLVCIVTSFFMFWFLIFAKFYAFLKIMRLKKKRLLFFSISIFFFGSIIDQNQKKYFSGFF